MKLDKRTELKPESYYHKEVADDLKSEIKIKINTLIWESAGRDLTLAQAENLACEIFDKIIQTWESNDNRR